MQEGEGGGERSEQATPKRLREARRLGQVAKSIDLSRAATAVAWLGLLLAAPLMAVEVGDLLLSAIGRANDIEGNRGAPIDAVLESAMTLLKLTAIPVALVAIVGVVVMRLHTGSVMSVDPIAPKFSRLDPIAGFKRLFSAANLFEAVKGIAKTAIIATVVYLVVVSSADDIFVLIETDVATYADLDHRLHVIVLASLCGLLLALAVLDLLFQRFNFLRSLRMSKQEIKRERKAEDGDPHLRSQRRRLQRQWATGNARQAARDATALVVNPTHIAIALYYDPGETPVPLVTAVGEGPLAQYMRHDAERLGVPVMRSVPLARKLLFYCEDDEEVPEILFDAVAEVLAWAESVRAVELSTPYREADADFDRAVSTDC